jgi:hypothetical protein
MFPIHCRSCITVCVRTGRNCVLVSIVNPDDCLIILLRRSQPVNQGCVLAGVKGDAVDVPIVCSTEAMCSRSFSSCFPVLCKRVQVLGLTSVMKAKHTDDRASNLNTGLTFKDGLLIGCVSKTSYSEISHTDCVSGLCGSGIPQPTGPADSKSREYPAHANVQQQSLCLKNVSWTPTNC